MQIGGINILCGHTVSAVERAGDEYVVQLSDNRTMPVDKVMFAIGRRPNVMGLGLDDAGVQIHAHGGIAVDEYSRTSVPHIYAVGDVTNRVNLTPVAIREGHAFADTLYGKKPTPVDHANVPTAVFTEPEVGVIGLTEEQAREKLRKVDVYKTTFRPMKATLSGRQTRSFMKLLVDAESDRVVGCHLVGLDAGELIQLVGVAVKMGATKADFDATMAVHPTAAEELVTMREKAVAYTNGIALSR
jgi:glutathione reductase (NADPH)